LAQLARYKVPRAYFWVAGLPRNALGKVQHFRLKEQVAAADKWPATDTEQS
jgi:fatty-acyl-CoA synthase